MMLKTMIFATGFLTVGSALADTSNELSKYLDCGEQLVTFRLDSRILLAAENSKNFNVYSDNGVKTQKFLDPKTIYRLEGEGNKTLYFKFTAPDKKWTNIGGGKSKGGGTLNVLDDPSESHVKASVKIERNSKFDKKAQKALTENFLESIPFKANRYEILLDEELKKRSILTTPEVFGEHLNKCLIAGNSDLEKAVQSTRNGFKMIYDRKRK
jgi:hypothetical protein